MQRVLCEAEEPYDEHAVEAREPHGQQEGHGQHEGDAREKQPPHEGQSEVQEARRIHGKFMRSSPCMLSGVDTREMRKGSQL